MATVKGKVYRVKEGIELVKMQDFGYDVIPSKPPILVKIIPQDIDGELCQGTLKNIYNNAEWKRKFYNPHKKALIEKLDLRYSHGKAKMTETFEHILTDWRIQIDVEDGWLGFASMDPFDRNVFYASIHLDTYCADEIKALLDADIIELAEVEQEVED